MPEADASAVLHYVNGVTELSKWAKSVLQRYRYPHAAWSVLLVLMVLIWVDGISIYLTSVMVGVVMLYPVHGSAMLVLGVLLSIVIGLEAGGSKPEYYVPDILPALFFILLTSVILRWKMQWEKDAGFTSIDPQWKELVGTRPSQSSQNRQVRGDNSWSTQQDKQASGMSEDLIDCMFHWTVILIGSTATVFLATLLAAGIPLNPESGIEIRLPPSVYRTISFGCVFLVGFSLSVILLRHLEWRSLSGAQARTHIRGFLQSMIGSDARRIERTWRKRTLKRVPNNKETRQ